MGISECLHAVRVCALFYCFWLGVASISGVGHADIILRDWRWTRPCHVWPLTPWKCFGGMSKVRLWQSPVMKQTRSVQVCGHFRREEGQRWCKGCTHAGSEVSRHVVSVGEFSWRRCVLVLWLRWSLWDYLWTSGRHIEKVGHKVTG